MRNPQEKSRIRVSGLSVTTNLPGLKTNYLCQPKHHVLARKYLIVHVLPQIWRADAPLSEAHGCKAVQMQSMWAQFCSQRPSCLAHEKTPTKAHEELSVWGEKSKKVNTTVKCDTKCDNQGWGCSESFLKFGPDVLGVGNDLLVSETWVAIW